MFFGPPLDVSDVRNSGEESEKDEGEDSVIIVPNSSGVTGIGRFFEDVDEGVEGVGFHGNLLVRWGELAKNAVRRPYYAPRPPTVRLFTLQFYWKPTVRIPASFFSTGFSRIKQDEFRETGGTGKAKKNES